MKEAVGLRVNVVARTETATSLHPPENSSDRAAGYRFPVVSALLVAGTKSKPYAVAVRVASQQPTQSSVSSGYVTADRAGLQRAVKCMSPGSQCNVQLSPPVPY